MIIAQSLHRLNWARLSCNFIYILCTYRLLSLQPASSMFLLIYLWIKLTRNSRVQKLKRCLNCVFSFPVWHFFFYWCFVSKIQKGKMNCQTLWLLSIFICLFYDAGVEPRALRALDQRSTTGLQTLPPDSEPKAFWIHTCFVHVVIYKLIASQRRKTCFFLYSQLHLSFYSYYCVCWGVAGWDSEVCTYAHTHVKVRGQPQGVPQMERPFVWDRVSRWPIASPHKLGRLTSGVGHLLVTTSTVCAVESKERGGARLWKQDLNLGPRAWNGNTWQVSL